MDNNDSMFLFHTELDTMMMAIQPGQKTNSEADILETEDILNVACIQEDCNNLFDTELPPASVKRISTSPIPHCSKYRLLDVGQQDEKSLEDIGIIGTEFFDLSPINSFKFCKPLSTVYKTKKNITIINDVEENPFSQFILNTEFNFDENLLDQNPEQNVNKIILTQLIREQTSDPDFPIENEEELPQSSQGFINDLANTTLGTVKKPPPAVQYIELQRQCAELNEENIGDESIDKKLLKSIETSQYQRDIELIFNDCEQTLNKTYSSENSNAQEINWSQDEFRMPKTSKSKEEPKSTENSLDEFFPHEEEIDQQPKSRDSFGRFYGLPMKVKHLIKEYKGISDLYDWQKECLALPAISRRNNLIYALPTSGGKTLVAEILMLREILCHKKNVIFVLPYVSIVQEKVWALSSFAVGLNFLVEEYAAGKGACPPRKRRKKNSIFIATIEKALALIDSLLEAERASEIGLIVVDELHIIGEKGRGASLEMFLTKAKFINAGIQIVGMSATIGNLPEVARFLKADTYIRDFRPVELIEYIQCGTELVRINKEAESIEDAFVTDRTLNFNYDDNKRKMDPDYLTGLVTEVIPDNSVLIFCPSKKNCENVAMLLCQIMSQKFTEYRQQEKEQLIAAIERDSGTMCRILAQTLRYGVAYHHSGLTGDERRYIEDAFRLGIIYVICCTSTLAAGVNLPAKRVIIRAPYVGRDFITLSRYKQMAGRAGRAGMGDVGESILICQRKDNQRVTELLYSPMDEAISSLHLDDSKGLRCLFLSLIGLQFANTRKKLHDLAQQTLLYEQCYKLKLNIYELTDGVIKKLFGLKAIQVRTKRHSVMDLLNNGCLTEIDENTSITLHNTTSMMHGALLIEQSSGNGNNGNQSVVSENQSTSKTKLYMKSTSELEISTLGRAAFKACIDMLRAQLIYKDLMKAQDGLILNDYLHLIYLITPYEPGESYIIPNMDIYYTQYNKLNPQQLQIANLIGITESCAVKMLTKRVFKTPLNDIVNRFYSTLILNELFQLKPIHEVATMFNIDRGAVQNLMNTTVTYGNCVLRFCEELDEFWCFRELIRTVTKRLQTCSTAELLPLMELPNVKIGRARQLYSAGYKSLQLIAKTNPKKLVESIEHMSYRIAKQLIATAKLLILERVESLREEAQEYLEILRQ